MLAMGKLNTKKALQLYKDGIFLKSDSKSKAV